MKVKFDSLNRYETPTLYLCNPGSINDNGVLTGIVGAIPGASEEELVLNFNALSELNFRVYKLSVDNEDENLYVNNIYRSIENRRYIYVDDIGYFVISNIKNGYSDETGYYKDIVADSVEIELQNKIVPYIEDGTYRFSDLMSNVLSVMPQWTYNIHDSSISEKFRTFEDISVDTNILSFLQQDVQDAYECVFIYDTINRKIDVYDRNNFVQETDVHLTKHDLINTIDISEDSSNLYTALRVTGGNNLNISPVNPLGTNVIYNFNYYLSWMSDGLRSHVQEWNNDVLNVENSIASDNELLYSKLQEQYNLEAEIDRLNINLDIYSKCKENIIATDGDIDINQYNDSLSKNGGQALPESCTTYELYNAVCNNMSEINQEIADTSNSLNTLKEEIEPIKTRISNNQESVQINSYFTNDELIELDNYIFEGSFNDEYTIVTDEMTITEKFNQMKELYRRGKNRLSSASSPSLEISIDVENLIFAKEFQHSSDKIEIGSSINAEIYDGEVSVLFLSNMTVNYENATISLTFGNKTLKFDSKTLFDEVMGDIKRSANTLDNLKDVVYPVKAGEINKLKEALEASRNLTMDSSLSSKNQEVVIDGSGYTGRKRLDTGDYDPRQVKIVSNSIVFTDDAWDTCKTALGEILLNPDGSSKYGLNAELIVGDMIVGGELHIKDENGEDILSVMDNKISMSETSTKDYIDDSDQKIIDDVNEKNKILSDESKNIQESISQLNIQAGEIEASVSEYSSNIDSKVDNLDGEMLSIKNTLSTKMSSSDLEIEVSKLDIDHVKTSSGFLFNEDGMTVSKSASDLKTQITEDGMKVLHKANEGWSEVLTADSTGVDAKDLKATTYLIVGGRSRFQNYKSDRTGCFWIGGI